jgi:nucleolin
MNNRIYVGNLVYEVDSQELARFFEQAGRVVYAKVVYSEDGKKSKGFGFVDFTNPEDAEQAIKTYHDSFMHGRRMRVAQAFRKNEQPPQAAAPDNKGKKDDQSE